MNNCTTDEFPLLTDMERAGVVGRLRDMYCARSANECSFARDEGAGEVPYCRLLATDCVPIDRLGLYGPG